MPCVIHWFRRDLRLTDNTALNAAVASGLPVVPVYILSEWRGTHRWTGYPRQSFLCGCLEHLARDLEAAGSRLVIRAGDAVEELRQLVQETAATDIFTNRDPDPYGREVENRLTEAAAELGVRLHLCKDHALHERDEVLKGDGAPYRVFTPYAKCWLKLEKQVPGTTVTQLERPPGRVKSLPLPSPAHWGLQAEPDFECVAPGEKAARKRMAEFIQSGLIHYKVRRDFPAAEGTSRLSQDLRWGLVSIRELYARCTEARLQVPVSARENIDTYISELAWREFYMMILFHYPEVLEQEFNADFLGLPWSYPADAGLERWASGHTGFPIVDAAMRQVRQTGFMHNRLRMITAMFLTKDLHVDWRQGEMYFMQRLVDGEIASNNGGWQWSAGCGADAAPYFRIQNPWTQGARFDADGEFIRRYVPELRGVPSAMLHKSPTSGRPLAEGYPLPMVDHAAERERTLRMFKGHREAAERRSI